MKLFYYPRKIFDEKKIEYNKQLLVYFVANNNNVVELWWAGELIYIQIDRCLHWAQSPEWKTRFKKFAWADSKFFYFSELAVKF